MVSLAQKVPKANQEKCNGDLKEFLDFLDLLVYQVKMAPMACEVLMELQELVVLRAEEEKWVIQE